MAFMCEAHALVAMKAKGNVPKYHTLILTVFQSVGASELLRVWSDDAPLTDDGLQGNDDRLFTDSSLTSRSPTVR